ncbi:hypothetical protein MYG64_36345 (plasmid) [Ensifer adhaerens]|uniref:hypothetical protein n=1 Tax=Ensifer adhaerens TaxID=106592 RepID=UPI00210183AB|nr:hypothetical protein [Ensifer adhaerens]UTV41927.1 hypothetical protein MYG64_36345 [Ensifer adhaerens]
MFGLLASPAYPPHFKGTVSMALLLLVLTSVHHAYGAYIYNTPWRLHIVHLAVPVAILVVGALFVGASKDRTFLGRVAYWLAAIVILAFPVAIIGFWEGGWNHVLKNVLYFGFGEPAARLMFPAPLYRLPDDLIFELTGIAQFPLAIIAAFKTISLLRRPTR